MNKIENKEKSCGAVIYKQENSTLFFMLEKHNKGHWSFAKGHVEEGESEEETAIREIKEESNIDVKLDSSFRKVSTYYVKKDTIKDVIIFIAEATTFNVVPQKEEISEIRWLSKDEALKILTYDDNKEILKEAIEHIQKKQNNK